MTRSILQSIRSFASRRWSSSKADDSDASSEVSSFLSHREPSSFTAQSGRSRQSTASASNFFSRFSSFNETGGDDELIFDERRANDVVRQYYPAWNGGRSEATES
ncbi:hypothetical protein IAR50_002581 [Cryptococcus sp. DSM 104548]